MANQANLWLRTGRNAAKETTLNMFTVLLKVAK